MPRSSVGSSSSLGGTLVAGQRVDDQADGVSARNLFVREVEDMAKEATQRRAQDMQNAELAVDRRGMIAHEERP